MAHRQPRHHDRIVCYFPGDISTPPNSCQSRTTNNQTELERCFTPYALVKKARLRGEIPLKYRSELNSKVIEFSTVSFMKLGEMPRQAHAGVAREHVIDRPDSKEIGVPLLLSSRYPKMYPTSEPASVRQPRLQEYTDRH
jgi:hypothetical protein